VRFVTAAPLAEHHGFSFLGIDGMETLLGTVFIMQSYIHACSSIHTMMYNSWLAARREHFKTSPKQEPAFAFLTHAIAKFDFSWEMV